MIIIDNLSIRTFLFPLYNFTGSYDGFVFHNHANSKNGHYQTTLANIEGSPLVVGGNSPTTNKAETYDISAEKWIEIAEYPYHNK